MNQSDKSVSQYLQLKDFERPFKPQSVTTGDPRINNIMLRSSKVFDAILMSDS